MNEQTNKQEVAVMAEEPMENLFTITGIIISWKSQNKVSQSGSEYSILDLVVEQQDSDAKYPQPVPMSKFAPTEDEIALCGDGKPVTATCKVRARKWTRDGSTRYFSNNEIVRLESGNYTQHVPEKEKPQSAGEAW